MLPAFYHTQIKNISITIKLQTNYLKYRLTVGNYCQICFIFSQMSCYVISQYDIFCL